MGDNKFTLDPECHAIIEAEANYGAGHLLFLQDRFGSEARDLRLSFDSIKTLAKRYDNSIVSTLWRTVEERDATLRHYLRDWKYRCSMVAMPLSYCPQHGAPVSRPIVPPTGIASYGKFEFGISMAPTVQNCSTSACFERVALGRLLQGLCGSRFTAVCGDSPGLTRHGSQSALVFANDQPWTKPIQRTFWKIR